MGMNPVGDLAARATWSTSAAPGDPAEITRPI
jgi:hypothetical protein